MIPELTTLHDWTVSDNFNGDVRITIQGIAVELEPNDAIELAHRITLAARMALGA